MDDHVASRTGVLEETAEVTPATEPAQSPARRERSVRAFGGYQPGFDGFRGLGVIFMVLYHAQLGPTTGAFYSISMFFTLSGFLIASILLDESRRTGSIALGRFWTRRFRRLAPAALLGVLAALVFGATVATRSQAEKLPEQVLGVVLYGVNWVFISTQQSYADLFASPSPVQHYWSLAIEEQFYVIIPLSFFALAKWRRSPVVAGGFFALVVVVATGRAIWMFEHGASIDRLYYGTDTRLAEVMIGVLLAVVLDHYGTAMSERVRAALAVAGLGAVAVMMWLWTSVGLFDDLTWRGGYALNGLLTCVVIVNLIAARGPAPWFFSWKPLVWLGRLSYGIYVYHFTIFLWLSEERTGLDPWPLFFVRMALTLVVTWLSYRFIETPIRTGATLGLRPSARLLVYPVAAAVLVVGTAATANTSGADPLATIRDDGTSDTVKVLAPDGVLDILVVASEGNLDVVAELEATVADDATVDVVVAQPFACDAVVDAAAGPVCANWLAEWPALVADHDPDSVLFFVDDWPGEPVPDLTSVLDNGLDLLTAGGANVVWAASGAPPEVVFQRALLPFTSAMGSLEPARDDLFLVLSGAMPNPEHTTDAAYLTGSADALLQHAALYQRADRSGAPRVMVVGDSQARSLGFGLERWGLDHDVWVWNVAVNGCGLADEGFTYGSGEETPVRSECVRVAEEWTRQVASFDPDVVVVFSSTWDLGLRRLDGWDEPASIGDPRFDEYLLREYVRATDLLSAEGARLVWMKAPCLDLPEVSGADSVTTDWVNTESLGVLNNEILPALVAQRPERVTLFDLAAVLCPGGEPLREADGVSPIRGDGAHFNVEGSAWFADRYGRRLLEAGGIG